MAPEVVSSKNVRSVRLIGPWTSIRLANPEKSEVMLSGTAMIPVLPTRALHRLEVPDPRPDIRVEEGLDVACNAAWVGKLRTPASGAWWLLHPLKAYTYQNPSPAQTTRWKDRISLEVAGAI